MASNNTYKFKNILVIAVWLLLGSGIVVLLIAAVTRDKDEVINGMEIKISGVRNNYFIDKKDVTKILEKTIGKSFTDLPASQLDLVKMERTLQKDQWIKKAEIFFDNNNVLQINITEREPIVRIFTTTGASFYMDSSLRRLPLSNKFSPRIPMFTGFPTEVKVLKKHDSLLLKDIKKLSEYIGNDKFWMAQIDQVDIAADRSFDLIPKLGNQVIHFGSIENYEQKFNKLLAFYKQVQTKTGWNRYSEIDLKFKNQVVAINRDAKEIKMDSLRAIQIMKNIIEEAKERTADSTSVQLAQQDDRNNINISVEKETIPEANNYSKNPNENKNESSSVIPVHAPEKPVVKNPETVVKPSVSRPSSNGKPNPAHRKKAAVKEPARKTTPVKKTEEKPRQVPKAVMPAQTDY